MDASANWTAEQEVRKQRKQRLKKLIFNKLAHCMLLFIPGELTSP
jgi:hypothetical protein